jgi:ribosomal protein L2
MLYFRGAAAFRQLLEVRQKNGRRNNVVRSTTNMKASKHQTAYILKHFSIKSDPKGIREEGEKE